MKTQNVVVGFDTARYKKDCEPLYKVAPAINRGVKNGLNEIGMRMVEIAQKSLDAGDLKNPTGRLRESIRYELIGDKGIWMTCDDEYGVYVEFGTGIVGAEKPHPHPWNYDINNHGTEGWWYKKDNKRFHTYGQTSKHFMYDAWLWASRSGKQIIEKNIRLEMNKIFKGK